MDFELWMKPPGKIVSRFTDESINRAKRRADDICKKQERPTKQPVEGRLYQKIRGSYRVIYTYPPHQ